MEKNVNSKCEVSRFFGLVVREVSSSPRSEKWMAVEKWIAYTWKYTYDKKRNVCRKKRRKFSCGVVLVDGDRANIRLKERILLSATNCPKEVPT